MVSLTRRRLFPLWAAAVVSGVAWLGTAPPLDAEGPLHTVVEFNRDIRPILSDTCFQCHGPDSAQRKAKLRLDTEAGAFADRGGRQAIIPGDPAGSELFRRITALSDVERMPPGRTGRQLTARQIGLIRRWIEQGAKWQKHWSFIPPTRPPLPQVKNRDWSRNGIDFFILDRLEREGLAPSPETDRAALIRRVTLDLTGLPPTLEEVDAFLSDGSPNAYEKVIDRLLASPRYGERMARPWLDAARYADTNGYQSDGERFMWRWRDWVIAAFNQNMPFTQFTVEQLAGDLLPNATLEQRIATGFNRNHRGNGEGGIIPEEYAGEYVVDRVETTATVWLGLTMGCARCHDHKYDPVTQKEFYQVFAFFNNVPERGKAVKFGNSPPVIRAPTPDQQLELQELEDELALAESRFAKLGPDLAAAQAKWEKFLSAEPPIDWAITRGLLVHYPLDDTRAASGGRHPPKDATGVEFQDGDAAFAPGRIGQAGQFDGKRFIDAGNVANFGFFDKFSCGAWIFPKGEQGGSILSRMLDVPRGVEGYNLHLEAGKLHVNLVKRWLDDAIRVQTEGSLAPQQWYHVLMTYDGSRVAEGVKIYVNGKPEKLKVNLDDLNQSFKVSEPYRIGSGGGVEGRFQGCIDDVRVYDRVLSADEVALLATADSITAIAAIPRDRRSDSQADKLRACFLEHHAPQPIRQAHEHLQALRQRRELLIENLPTTMVMAEMPTPRDTFVLLRGRYDKPGEKVAPGIPAVFSPPPGSAQDNRLKFAHWLMDSNNPLTARVAVNRYWQMYFGTGLVKTVDDFGAQGEWPSHPELLDWLATEFIRLGWDIKAIQKLIVTSATYRQSSRVSPQLLQRDPENRLLARGPRLRLSAEMVRDQALAISGLLAERLGGPSVKPYQPAGLWKELTGSEGYKQDHGADLYRRGLYTFWKRTIAPPQMITFDAAGRETCIVRETRTNTPLQALTLMNDVTYVEAARVLAQRIMTAGGTTPEERITLAFRLATARQPKQSELQILVDGFQDHLVEYRRDREAALRLIRTGESPRAELLDVSELAAYTAVAGLILNLDELITKD
jgi:hypothetical protein